MTVFFGRRARFSVALAILFGLSAPAAATDIGDYTAFKAFRNLIRPPVANNPVDRSLVERFSLNDGTPVIEFDKGSIRHKDGFNSRLYGIWQSVTLDGYNTGAVCADGSNYKFLVKRSAKSSNMVVSFEGGGGCWDKGTCGISKGGFTNAGLFGGHNGNPLPGITLKATASLSNLSTTALRPGYHPRFKKWTRVYMPYCSQDLHVGNTVNNYEDSDGEKLKVTHNGLQIQGTVLRWLKDNLEQPGQLLMTGQSAGGFGSELLYHPYRVALEPRAGYLLNDAGPLMPAPQGSKPNRYPSGPVHRKVAEAWNVSNYLNWMQQESNELPSGGAVDISNLGNTSQFLSESWPSDRFMLAAARKDNVISGFTYNPFFKKIGKQSLLEKRDVIRDKFRFKDMKRKRKQLNKLSNFGYFVPGYRPLSGGHVMTIPLIEASTANEDDGNNIFYAIANLMNGQGRVMQSWEGNTGLKNDLNGRYRDCVNMAYLNSGNAMESGEVYLDLSGEESEKNSLQLFNTIVTGQCRGLIGTKPISQLAPASER